MFAELYAVEHTEISQLAKHNVIGELLRLFRIVRLDASYEVHVAALQFSLKLRDLPAELHAEELIFIVAHHRLPAVVPFRCGRRRLTGISREEIAEDRTRRSR